MTKKSFIGISTIHTMAVHIAEVYGVERRIVEDMIIEECERENSRSPSSKKDDIIKCVMERVFSWLDDGSIKITAVMIADRSRPFLFFNKLIQEYREKEGASKCIF